MFPVIRQCMAVKLNHKSVTESRLIILIKVIFLCLQALRVPQNYRYHNAVNRDLTNQV